MLNSRQFTFPVQYILYAVSLSLNMVVLIELVVPHYFTDEEVEIFQSGGRLSLWLGLQF